MSSLIRHFFDPSWTPSLPEDSMETPNSSYVQSSVEDLQEWVEKDENKIVLVERQHVPGREEQAIKFAEYMETFKNNRHKKFKNYREFYEYLQTNVTTEKDYEDLQGADDVTGFSDSSCKRLRTEGNCYIRLRQKGYNDFPQSQTAAIALFLNTTEENILDVWKDALDKCGGNKKRVFKADVCAAIKRFNDDNPSAEVLLEEANKKLEEKQKELDEAKKEAKKKLDEAKTEAKKQIDLAKKETIEELQYKQELLDEFCLAYEDENLTKPIYNMEQLAEFELPDETPEERLEDPSDDPNTEGPAVYVKCKPSNNGVDVLNWFRCSSMKDWKEVFFEYGVYFSEKKSALKGNGIGKGKGRGKGVKK